MCAVVACGQSQLDGKPTATVESVETKAEEGPKEAPGQPLAADPKAAVAKPAAPQVTAKPKSPTPPTKDGGEGPEVKGAEKSAEAPQAKRPDPMENAERDLVLDPRRSSVSFVGRKVTADNEGSFGDFEGTAKLKGYTPQQLKVTIQMGSVSTGHPKLTNHLKNADFFNAEKYPTARFSSTKIRPGGEGVATHTITGELSMLAVTKRITFPATIVVTDAGATGLAEFKINRKDFGIVYPGRPDDLIADEVLLKLNLAYLDKRYVR